MDEAPREGLIEWGVDAAAAAIFAASLAFAWLKLVGSGAGAAVAPMLAFVVAFAGLRRIKGELPTFNLPPIEGYEVPVEPAPDELLLTQDMAMADGSLSDELVLDDVLASLDPDSRVVQLFRPMRLPTAGELRETIDRHLGASRPQPAVDASAALHQALAELRGSLR